MTAIIIKMVSKKDKQLHKDFKKHCKSIYGADRHVTPHIRKLMEQELNK